MASIHKTIQNPVTGHTITFKQTSQDTGGKLLQVEAVYKPGNVPPPEHFHPKQDEKFVILEGELHFLLNGKEQIFTSGNTVEVPAGLHHAIWNVGPKEAKVIWDTKPALKTEFFFENIFGLASEGKTNAKGVPNLLQMAVLLREYQEEIRFSKPPVWIQTCVSCILGPIGWALGYQAKDPRYSS